MPDATRQPDLALCEAEPIHIPGAIQPHGAVIAAVAETGLISHASANLAAFIGVSPEAVLGIPIAEVIGVPAWRDISAAARAQAGFAEGMHGCVAGFRGQRFTLRGHATGAHVCVDIEPAAPEGGAVSQFLAVQPVLESFRHAGSDAELCDMAVGALSRITGYDRVMAYRFGDDGNGEVVAEAVRDGLEPYLGLRYPASDIPVQARRQYLRHPVGMIADSAYLPVPLLSEKSLDGGVPIDLTHSALRSVSPLHRQYMRNMGTVASLTVALTAEDGLWGMMVCHHGSPLAANVEIRAAAEVIGQMVSARLAILRELATDEQRARRHATLGTLLQGLAESAKLPEGLAAMEHAFLAVVGASGGAICLDDTFICVGRTPARHIVEHVMGVMQAASGGQVLAVDSVAQLDKELACWRAELCGAMLVPLGQGGRDALLWVRPEHPVTVTWGGDPASHATADPRTGLLSPRASFRAWQQVVRGRAVAWSEADRALAQDLGHAVEAEYAQRTRVELERALGESRAKSRFLAGISHELRTPLNGILGYAQLLGMEGGLNPLQSRRVDAMMSAGTHLLRIISRVLELSEIEAEHASFEPAMFDPRLVAGECLNLVRPMAEAKALFLRLVTACDVPAKITTDPTRFRQILFNLLGNAVKFTRAGGVEVQLRMAADGVSLRVDVVDTGPGIEVAQRHRLFREFQQLGAMTEGGDSAGLGLAITARLVGLLGGCLGHKENPHGGSIFWLELPLTDVAQAAPDEPPAWRETARSDAPQARLRVLVADDSAINRDIAHAFLKAAGHEVSFAEDGAEAVAAVAAADFDAVLMDIRMPRMGGLEATRRIRGLDGPRGQVPVVALTASAFSDQVDECRNACMDGHLAKPFTMDSLLAALARATAPQKVRLSGFAAQ